MENLLTDNEKQRIKNFSRYEDDIIKPKIWNFLKDKASNFCIIREYSFLNCNVNSEEALDLAILNKEKCSLIYGIEIKALPLTNPNNGLANSYNRRRILNDFRKLIRLFDFQPNLKLGLFFLSLSYKATNQSEQIFNRRLNEIYSRLTNNGLQIRHEQLEPDIDLGNNIKIRNFLFVIEPNQSS